jgi:para-nitrobenzyl esterase
VGQGGEGFGRAGGLTVHRWIVFSSLLAFGCAQAPSQSASPGLGGTSWQLVKFQGGDGAVLTPDDRSKYTVAFGADGVMRARIDCNRANGGWKSAGPNHLEFGLMAATRAQCPPGSLHDQIVRQLANVRSYVVKDGRLFLSLMADGGVYEFEPVR